MSPSPPAGALVIDGLVPEARGEEQAYFEHCRAGRLALQWCPACERHIFYPRAVCPHCLDRALEWRDAEGRGTVYSFTDQHRAPAGMEAEVPFTIALVDLHEGVRMLGRLVAPGQAATIGMPVRVEFAWVRSTDLKVPVFVPEAPEPAEAR